MLWRGLEELARDVRYGFRSLAGTPVFTAVALATLAIGIGATTLIFSIVSGVLLRPLPFPNAERLVQVQETTPSFGPGAVTFANIAAYRRSASIDAIAGYARTGRILHEGIAPERIVTVASEPALFGVLGVDALAGRTFRDDDPLNVAVVGAAFATRRFGTAAGGVGRTIRLDDAPFTIVGVMAESFRFPYSASRGPLAPAGSRVEIWVPLVPPAGLAPNQRRRIDSVVARLKGVADISVAEQELAAIVKRISADFPETGTGHGILLRPLTEVVTGDVRPSLVVLMGAVGLVLLVACANVANLLLVRATTRAREMAVRGALGASRTRLIRQLVTESVVLSIAGAALGVAIAAWGAPLVVAAAAEKIPRADEIGIDWRVFVFVLGVSVATGLAFGLAPAIEAARDDVSGALRGTTPAGGGRRRRRVRDGLAVAEVALAMMLLVGSGLLMREFLRLQRTDEGIGAPRVLTAHLSPALTPPEYQLVVERVKALPGVHAAAFAQMLPLQNWGWTGGFVIRGRPLPSAAEQPSAELRYVTPGYFQTLGIPIVRGRGFTDADTAGAPRVIVVNEALVRRHFGAADPVGQATDRGLIVGVARDVRQTGVDREPVPEIFYAIAQNIAQLRELGMSLIVSTEVPPESLAAAVRTVVRELHPQVAMFSVKTLDEIRAESMADHTLNTSLLAVFAAIAVGLACAGIYGVVSYGVSARTREFGIRMALGADRGSVMRLVTARGAAMTGVGLAVGMAGSVAFARLLGSMLPGAGRLDPLTVLLAAALLGAVALIATLLPAARAARVDPLVAVRTE